MSGQIWFQEDFRNSWGACPWEDDLAICQEVSFRCFLWLSALAKISHAIATYQYVNILCHPYGLH